MYSNRYETDDFPAPPTSPGYKPVIIDKYASLTESISQNYEHVRSGQDSVQATQWQRELEKVLKGMYPNAKLYLIGSQAYDLQLEDSTIDFMLLRSEGEVITFDRENTCRILENIKQYLVEDVQNFAGEVVDKPLPMLQIQDTNTGLEGNIFLHYMPSLQNTYLIRCYAEIDPRIKPLVFIIKMWATREKLVNVKGKLTGFSLLQLIIHYLQVGCKPPVVPALQEKYQGTFRLGSVVDMFNKVEQHHIPEEILAYKSGNTKKVGELLVGFFRFYAHYSWGTYGQAISIRTSKGTTNKPKFDDTWSKPFLRIEDPFDLKNIGAGCTQHGAFSAIKQAFIDANNALNNNPTIDSLFA